VLFGCYLVLAALCWFFFWHHPSHIGIKIRSNHDNAQSFGFVVDNTTTFWNPTSTHISHTAGRRNVNSTLGATTANQSLLNTAGGAPSRYTPVDDDLVPENRSHEMELVKMDVTLIDAFKIKEINLLITSYVFTMCHNLQILQSTQYTGITLELVWFSAGSIVGTTISGILVDLVFKKRLFLAVLILDILIFGFDLYMYTQDFSSRSISDWQTFCLGSVMSSLNIIYLILLPMLIAK